MKRKWTIFTALAVFLVLVVNLGFGAISTREIDGVRNKSVLNEEDLQIIDNFVTEAVRELVRTRDFTTVSRIRSVILARASSSRTSAAAQYAEQFSESSYKYITLGFEQAKELEPEERKLKAIINLLILIDGLEDLRLANLAMEKLNDKNTIVRYWAVHSITNAGIIKQLNSGEAAGLTLAEKIVGQLKELVDQVGPEIIALMTRFAAEVQIPQGEDLLLQIADMRIKRYADWTVKYELLDGEVLRLLYGKTTTSSSNKSGMGRRFGQLFSFVFQRYIKGQDFLGAAQKHQLASVLVEMENKYIVKITGIRQSTIKRVVEGGDYAALLQEHSRLLGDETRPGQLPLKLNFHYGNEPDGSGRTWPLALPEPPKELIIDKS